MNRKFKLKNKRRFYIFVMMISITLSSLSLVATANGADTNDNFNTIVVESGDTLWDIAKEYSNEKDLRQYIRDVEEINELSDGLIYEGDILKLPV